MLNSKNLRAYYPLQNDVKDYSVAAKHGIVYGTAQYEAGKIGSSFKFNGATYIEGGVIEPQQLTVAFWFKNTQTSAQYSHLVSSSQQLPGGYAVNYAVSWDYIARKIGFSIQTNTTTVQYTPALPYADNVWFHVAATFNGTTKKIYINGLEVATQSLTTEIVYPTSGNRNIQIGRWGYSDWNRIMTGGLQHVMIYDKALSSSDVKRLYLNLHPIK